MAGCSSAPAYQPKCKEQNRTGGTRWAPPPTGMAKLNVDIDAVVSKGSNRGAIAAVARDEAGRFLGASALVLTGITEGVFGRAPALPKTAPALAL